mmetsp:Transcript_5798/g.10401  ORF Transcript_5798/g.10401 Transcript_5798/m.10401 type:complete len:287 (-) Transcript_5798:72-932(-)
MFWYAASKYSTSASACQQEETRPVPKAAAGLWQLRGSEFDQARSISTQGHGPEQEAWTPQRPTVAPLSGLQAGGHGGTSRPSQTTPRSALRSQPELRVSWPNLEIERMDMEAMAWWFSEVEASLAMSIPDARCPFPWIQDMDAVQADEVLEELSDSFTFKDFKKGWNYADYAEFPSWYEGRMQRLSSARVEEALAAVDAPRPGRSGRSRSHSSAMPPWKESREGRLRNSAPALGFAVPSRTTSLTPRLLEADELTLGASSSDLRPLAREDEGIPKPRGLRQCHSAR